MSQLGATIRDMFFSFRDSVGSLFDEQITADDARGIVWLVAIGIVVYMFLWVLRTFDKRRPMRR